MFRLDVRYGIQVSSDRFIIVKDRILHEIDVKNKIISQGYQLIHGNRPLNIVPIKIDGFDNSLYFGEYFSNKNRKPVGIYKRTSKDKWEMIYEFKAGEINHIHNLIPDEINKCVWILTGDFGQSAAIWQARNNFKTVKVVLRGEQIFRSCVAFPYKGGLIYATDTPFQKNTLRFLYKKNEKWETPIIAEINGSAVYTANIGDNFIFSTVVENNGGELLLKKIITFKRGEGIIKNEAVVYRIDNDLTLDAVVINKKDFLPFFLFQFGSMSFPTGINRSDYLPIYNIGTKKYDMSLSLYKSI
jgi:hypothetical protein